MSARYLQPSMCLDGASVVEHTNRPGRPDAVRVRFADGGWVWMEDPADARQLAAAFTEAADRLDALLAAKAVTA